MSRRHSRALVDASRQLQAEIKASNAAVTSGTSTSRPLDLLAMQKAAMNAVQAHIDMAARLHAAEIRHGLQRVLVSQEFRLAGIAQDWSRK